MMKQYAVIIAVIIGAALHGGCSRDRPALLYDNQRDVEPEYVEPSASRTSGVAPLSVHFTAGFISSLGSERQLHDYNYIWDFGDPGSGNWGTTGRSKNTARGPVAAHVYENAGTYTATVTIRNPMSIIDSHSFEISVHDPDVFYSGTKTTCISDTAHNDFDQCPAGAVQIVTDDLSSITAYADAGHRILLHRGSSWVSGDIDFPENGGPVTIAAYGACDSADELGICGNAPSITLTGNFCDLTDKQDWRIHDITFNRPDKEGGIFGGAWDMRRILILRLKTRGFGVPVGITHYNQYDGDLIDEIVVISCDLAEAGQHIMYIGSERLALLGNIARDADESHVVRVWQGYLGVISHNIISGSSLTTDSGRHALKLHGPGYSTFSDTVSLCDPEAGTTCLEHRSEFMVISGNVFGSSGPWPVAIGPQDAYSNEYLSDIIFERNRIHPDYGSQSLLSNKVSVGLSLWASYVTVRNNIIDGTGAGSSFTGINITQRGLEPVPICNRIFNNTIYRQDEAGVSWGHNGVKISAEAVEIKVINNLVRLPESETTLLINDAGNAAISGSNLMTATPGLVDPENPAPLLRDFSLQDWSPAVGAGEYVPVYDDFLLKTRSKARHDLGAVYYMP